MVNLASCGHAVAMLTYDWTRESGENPERYRRCMRGVCISLMKVSHWGNLRRQNTDDDEFGSASQKTYKMWGRHDISAGLLIAAVCMQ